MSSDELIALLTCGVLALSGLKWLFHLVASPGMGWPRFMRVSVLLVPFLCLVGMVVLLKKFSAHDVRDSMVYMFFYTVMGIAWVHVAIWPASFIGLNLRGDVIDRRNPAAAWAGAGLLIGLTLGFTGGNIGDGPGWWVVVFCAILETLALYLLWLIAEPIARFNESITVERDPAAGIRLGGLLAGSGLILGRAVAGDWVSYAATVSDFSRDALGLIMIWGFAVILEFIVRPTADRAPGNVVLVGVFPSVLYLGGAVAWLMHVGWWS